MVDDPDDVVPVADNRFGPKVDIPLGVGDRLGCVGTVLLFGLASHGPAVIDSIPPFG